MTSKSRRVPRPLCVGTPGRTHSGLDAEYDGVSESLLTYATRQREVVRGQYDAVPGHGPSCGAPDRSTSRSGRVA